MTKLNSLPILAVTMGDPSGVGPEVCLKLMQHREEVLPQTFPIIVGDREILRRVAEQTKLPMPPEAHIRQVDSLVAPQEVTPGKVLAACGQAAFDYLKTAIDWAQSGDAQAIVTAPINKEALRAAGIDFPGHTEILTALTQSDRSCMLQYSEEVTASFVTCHCGYAEVTKQLTRGRLREVIDLTHIALERVKGRQPRLVTLGLNPHAGERGLFGNHEEEETIRPEVEAAIARGIDIAGPIPPDTAFLPHVRRATDAFICMYHDQGHIPLKALAFDSAVNVTLGLPIVRTSVDHGTAFDIAWQGKANPGSMFAAARLALQLADLKRSKA